MMKATKDRHDGRAFSEFEMRLVKRIKKLESQLKLRNQSIKDNVLELIELEARIKAIEELVDEYTPEIQMDGSRIERIGVQYMPKSLEAKFRKALKGE